MTEATQARQAGFEALFNPKGILIAGASSHPGKFGFVSLHNVLASGFEGRVQATNLKQETILGVETLASVEDMEAGSADLVMVCTPKSANLELIERCAQKGVKAAFITSAGYGEASEQGRADEDDLVATARRLGVLLAGPNGQGVVSTPSKLCAQIVAPYPPAGVIGIASQSGNFVSSFMNWSVASQIGISRAVSAGNAADASVVDYLEYYANDDATKVGLAYLEGISDGRALYEAATSIAAKVPLVLVKGGSTDAGASAASSHTGSLATNDVVFRGAMAQAGATLCDTVEGAFEAAAAFATQPLPKGNRVVVMTTAGGWGVVTADAIARSQHLELLDLPDDLRAALDELLPPRWSKSNPVDLAGGETRDTIPAVLDAIAAHDEVDAIIHLGLGIQSNQAKMMAASQFYPDHGLERIVDYHRRQDERFAVAAVETSQRYNKPILTATELAVTDPQNSGPQAVRAAGRLCFASANRAVNALDHMVGRAQYLTRRGQL